jgi:tetratricopeptide (TPR) repeat protein
MKFFYLFVCIAILTNATHAQSPSHTVDQTGHNLSVNLGVAGSSTLSADFYFEEANRIEKIGDFDGAIAMFSKAANEYQQNKMFGRYGTALIRLSNVHLTISNYAEAEKIVLRQVLRNYTKIGSKSGQMLAYQQLGKVYLAANKLPESMWFYTQHGILAQQLQDKSAYIESVIGIASVKIKKKDYALASKDLNAAELLSKNSNIVQYDYLIKSNRAKIPEKFLTKKS